MELSDLINDLNSNQPDARCAAAEQLSRHPQAAAAAVSLVRTAGDANESVREWAVAGLEAMGAPSPADLSALVDLLSDSNDDVAYWAATLIGRLGEHAAEAVPALAAALDPTRAGNVRQRSAWALGRIGPAAAPASASLEASAAGEDVRLARLAQRALKEISP